MKSTRGLYNIFPCLEAFVVKSNERKNNTFYIYDFETMGRCNLHKSTIEI